MELPDDAPKFPKLPFLLGDALLIGTAAYLAYDAGSPLPAAAVYAITACVALGALLAALPFVVDYSRRQDALLSERQNALEALARTTSAAVEQASIAAGGLHQISELAQRGLRAAEQLPHKLQERLNDFHRIQDESLSAELESLQQEVNTLRASDADKLDSAADKIQRAVSELAKFDGALHRRAMEIDAAVRRAEPAIAGASGGAAPTTVSAPAPRENKPEPGPAAPDSAGSATAPPGNDRGEAGERMPAAPATVRKSAARRRTIDTAPPNFPTPLVNAAVPVEATPDATKPRRATNSKETPSDDSAQLSPDEANPEPAMSSDGATRLIVTAYIGIGNKLFIRGKGAGLSWDRGVPLQFISIGKWRWESAEASGPVVAKLYKNDQVECISLGEMRLEPGHQQEVTASF